MESQLPFGESIPTRTSSLLPVPEGPFEITAPVDGAGDGSIRLSLIIPTYNESKNLPELVSRLSKLLDAALGSAYELVVVDDDSPDRTWKLAQQLAAENPRLRVMRRVGERGLSTAVIRGWQAARGEFLGVIDADLQHPPEVLLGLWREMERGADLAVASRHVEGGGVSDWSVVRRILSRGAQLLGLLVLPSVVGRVSDPMSGYFIVRRRSIEAVRLNPIGYKILIEVIGRGTIPWISEVGYVFRERTNGESKVTSKVYLDYLAHLVRLRLASPSSLRFVSFASVGLIGMALDMAMLFILSDPRMLGWNLLVGKLFGAELAIVNNFLLNDAVTFRDLTATRRCASSKPRRFLKFNAICGMGLALHVMLLWIQVQHLAMNRYVANAIAIALVTAWNYLLNAKLSWGVTPPAARTDEEIAGMNGTALQRRAVGAPSQ